MPGAIYRTGLLATDQVGRIKAYSDHLRNSNDTFHAPTFARRRSTTTPIVPGEHSTWLYQLVERFFHHANHTYRFDVLRVDEPIQLIRYGPTGCVDWHFDCGEEEENEPHRKLSLSIQLSDENDYSGGDLEFVGTVQHPFGRRLGTVIVFPSFSPHRVTPVTSGVRESLVAFMLGPRLR